MSFARKKPKMYRAKVFADTICIAVKDFGTFDESKTYRDRAESQGFLTAIEGVFE